MVAGTAVFDGFLGESVAGALLEFALARQSDFCSSTIVGSAEKSVQSDVRSSSTFSGDWHEHKARFADAVLARTSDILDATGVADWSPKAMQIDLAAHRDGDFFKPHIDTVTGRDRPGEVRMVSAVYYVHRQPKRFSGGDLLIRDVRGQTECAVEPLHDRLVVFPSMLPHEVAPISVPGNDFADARFSVNCWLNRVKA